MTRKSRRQRPASATHRKHFQPRLEVLEDRLAPATFTVLNTLDSGAGSLRQAILDANAAANIGEPDRIEFKMDPSDGRHFYYRDDNTTVPGQKNGQVTLANRTATTAIDDAAIPNLDPDWAHSWWSIAAPAGLPNLTGNVIIDGYSQPGSSPNTQLVGSDAVHRVEVDFADSTSTAFGLTGNRNTIQGMVISRAQYNAISITSGGGNTVVGNYIGTDVSGTLARGGSVGVRLGIASVTTDNRIGGPQPADRNVIIATVTFGPDRTAIYIHNTHGAAATPLNNVIQGNYIGTNAAGSASLQGGLGKGITFSDASNNTISGNVISGTVYGIWFGGFTANNNNVIQGNLIGLDAGGSFAIPNSDGIAESGQGTIIGGTTAAERNVISGNRGHGISSRGASTQVLGNYIGTDAAGSYAVPNSSGIDAIGHSIVIGGTEPGAGNLISGNTSYGILKGNGFGDGGTRTIQGNLIGTNATGTAAIPNSIGIALAGTGSFPNLIGGDTPAARNIISGNSWGIQLVDSSAVVQGNYIGTDITGKLPLGNSSGVRVFGEFVPLERALIGGATPGSGNVIAFNRDTGVDVDIRAQDRATILGNSIHDNGALGIELPHQANIHRVTGPTPNDLGDADDGSRSPNALQNYPVLSSASSGGGITTVAGSLNSLPGNTFRIEFVTSQ